MTIRGKAESIPAVDILIINAPALAFLFLGLASALFSLHLRFPTLLGALALAWWSACGAFMLCVDFLKRKKALYLRLRSPGPPPPDAPLSRSLRSTPCGYAVWAAASRYSRSNRTWSG